MSNNRDEFLRSNVYHFSVLVVRVLLVLVVGYLFYKLIILPADAFSSGFLFAKSWAVLYIISASAAIIAEYVINGIPPGSYLGGFLYRWPQKVALLGLFAFYFIPFALALFQ